MKIARKRLTGSHLNWNNWIISLDTWIGINAP
jgi:hypothetical protein